MKTQITKEQFDFLKSIGMLINSSDGKTYIHLPHVFEVVSESYNTVIEHYSDKKLPDDVKQALIDNAICKPTEAKIVEDMLLTLRGIRDEQKVSDRLIYNPACDKLAVLHNKLVNNEN